MSAANRTKASEKLSICKKIITQLKKRYKVGSSNVDRPVLETMIYAVCLEDVSVDQADAAFDALDASFHDLNEIRVSSITELTAVLADLPYPELRALRIRCILQHVFEDAYQFEFEKLRKRTLDSAGKQLSKIPRIGHFIKTYTLQASMGSHLIPVDEATRRACIWLGMADVDADCAHVSEVMKSALRKADAPVFCQLIRALATDESLNDAFDLESVEIPDDGFDPLTATDRLTELLAGPKKTRRTRKAATKGRAKKTATKTKRKSARATTSAKKKAKSTARKKATKTSSRRS